MAVKRGIVKSEDIRTMKKDIARVRSGEELSLEEVGLMPREEKVRQEMAERERWEKRRKEQEEKEKLEKLRVQLEEKDKIREMEAKKGLADQEALESLKRKKEEDV